MTNVLSTFVKCVYVKLSNVNQDGGELQTTYIPTSQARVFIPPRTTAKTLVAAGHVNPQILGVIRIIASLGT